MKTRSKNYYSDEIHQFIRSRKSLDKEENKLKKEGVERKMTCKKIFENDDAILFYKLKMETTILLQKKIH